MIKVIYTSLLIIGFSANVFSQNINEIFGDSIPMDITEHYQWISDFNQQTLFPTSSYKNDKTHRLDSIYGSQTDIFNSTTSYSKSLYFSSGKKDISVSYSSSHYNSEWQPIRIIVYHYNDENLIIKSTFSYWDGDLSNLNDDNPLVLRTYHYDNDNKLIEIHIQEEYAIINNIPQNVINYEYNDDGFVTDIITSVWSADMDSFSERSGFHYEYDDGLLKNWIRYGIDENIGYHTKDSILYYHNSSGLVEQELKYSTSSTDIPLRLRRKTYSEYDNDDRLLRQENRDLFRDNFDQDVDTIYYNYYPSGSLKDITYTRTDSSQLFIYGFVFERVSKRLKYEYNDSIAYESILRPGRNTRKYEENHMLIRAKEYDDVYNFFPGSESNLGETDRTRYYYSEIIRSSTEETKEDESYFSITPNPVQDEIEIISSDSYSGDLKIMVTDIDGRRIMQQKTYANKKIDLSHLSPGVYVYMITSNDKRSTGKIVVH